MALALPPRLLRQIDGHFSIINPRDDGVVDFDIISYTWGGEEAEYDPEIEGVTWPVKIPKPRLRDIKRLMISQHVRYMWADCVCIKQTDEGDKAVEVARMYEYYMSARRCHILIDLPVVWEPQKIVNDLRFLGHILAHMEGAALASDAYLTQNLTNILSDWEKTETWVFPISLSMVKSAGVEPGVLNCYSTCIERVRSLFENLYFSRVWTFQEMLLGKNITMWGINASDISCIRELETWMDLAIDVTDKAFKLERWIDKSWDLKPRSVEAILRIIKEDMLVLNSLQTQVKGISGARTDIINGGPLWWVQNHRGISNIFSAISIMPRQCRWRPDIFRGLLGVFSGLFTANEIESEMGCDDIEALSFAFFKQLSIKTGRAWTKLAISSRARGEWDWIPVTADSRRLLTTDCFAGVVNLGRLKKAGPLATTTAVTGLTGTPRPYMKITLNEGISDFQFIFKGCNCGKKIKTGAFKSELIATNDMCQDVAKDQTGSFLVQCATMLGSILDPGCSDIPEYRRRLLGNLQPEWEVTDPNAKLARWEDRCVSGTDWENPHPFHMRVHNMSANYRMVSIKGCGSRLQNESTDNITCHVRVDCGCTITAPFALFFEALTAVEGSFLGKVIAKVDDASRIVLRDGLGLVQVGDVGRAFNLVAFGGDIGSYRSYASACRSTRITKPVVPKLPWPTGKALVREEFSHDFTDAMRDYGYVKTGGSGNLLISRKNPVSNYKIVGVCIDEDIANKKGPQDVTIQ